jgi:hypothetical protein
VKFGRMIFLSLNEQILIQESCNTRESNNSGDTKVSEAVILLRPLVSDSRSNFAPSATTLRVARTFVRY